MKDEILPCPFCGLEEYDKNPPFVDKRTQKHFGEFYVVSCQCCGSESNHFSPTEELAINVWNTRKSTKTEIKMKFEWKELETSYGVRTLRSKVFGGWIIRSDSIANDHPSKSMVFVPDPEHKCQIDDE